MIPEDIRLFGYSNIYNQVIVGGSCIKISFSIHSCTYPEDVRIDVANYSNKGTYEIHPKTQKKDMYDFEEIITVDFLGKNGISCGKNNNSTRIKVMIGDREFYSNPIGDYTYTEDFMSIDSSFFKSQDHHLGVYNQFESSLKKSVAGICELETYPNDIIFVDKKESERIRFVELKQDIQLIIKKYLQNMKSGKQTIFYVNLFSPYLQENIEFTISKIISICRPGSYYLYHVEENILEKYNFDRTYYLYDHHFPPIIVK